MFGMASADWMNLIPVSPQPVSETGRAFNRRVRRVTGLRCTELDRALRSRLEGFGKAFIGLRDHVPIVGGRVSDSRSVTIFQR